MAASNPISTSSSVKVGSSATGRTDIVVTVVDSITVVVVFTGSSESLFAYTYIFVILALALSGRNVPYPGAYLKPYRRS